MTAAFAALLAISGPAAFAQTAMTTHAAAVPSNHILPGQIRVTQMDGANVYDTNTQKIGDIKDIILDREGRVAAVVLDVGSTLGIGGKYVAVSMNDVHVRMENNTPHFSVDMTKDQLKSAQAYDLSEKNLGSGTSTPPANLKQ
jgi:sporulation protein YlmC with PRC-barrel domain